MYGKKHSLESNLKNKEKHLDKHHTDKTKQKLSNIFLSDNNPMFNKTVLSIWIEKYGKKEALQKEKIRCQKISEALKKRKRHKIICQYCNKEIDLLNYKKWHDNNCKKKEGN